MQDVEEQDRLSARLERAVPGLRPPQLLVRRLAEELAGEDLLLLAGDVRALGFGAYEGQVCAVTPRRVLLATATRQTTADSGFTVEQWERQVAPVPLLHPRPRPAAD